MLTTRECTILEETKTGNGIRLTEVYILNLSKNNPLKNLGPKNNEGKALP